MTEDWGRTQEGERRERRGEEGGSAGEDEEEEEEEGEGGEGPGLCAIALWSVRVELAHPATGERLCVEMPMPRQLQACLEAGDMGESVKRACGAVQVGRWMLTPFGRLMRRECLRTSHLSILSLHSLSQSECWRTSHLPMFLKIGASMPSGERRRLHPDELPSSYAIRLRFLSVCLHGALNSTHAGGQMQIL